MGARYADFIVYPGMTIAGDVDRHFRTRLLELADRVGPDVGRALYAVLADPPSQGGTSEAMRYLGDEGPRLIKRATRVVEYLEYCENGFMRWLDVTGFGNDVNMIKALLLWSEKRGAWSEELAQA